MLTHPSPCPAPRYLMFGFIQHEPARLPRFHEGSFLVQRPLVGPAGARQRVRAERRGGLKGSSFGLRHPSVSGDEK